MQISPQLSVVGCAMVSSISLDVRVACAAARAGLRRTRRSEYAVLSDQRERVFLSVHEVHPLTRGFQNDLRLARMLTSCLRELWRADCEPAGAANRSVGLYLGLPPQHRTLSHLSWMPDDTAQEKRRQLESARPVALDSQQRGRQLLRGVCELAGLEPTWRVTRFVEGGHDTLAACLKLAAQDLHSSSVELAVVGAVDSLLDQSTLRWLEETSRLKTPRMPVGLEAGEGCGLLLLEPRRAVHARRARPSATISALAERVDPKPYTELEPATGAGYTSLFEELSMGADWGDRNPPWMVVDHNGEVGRASDWAYAMVRLQGTQPHFARAHVTYPATSFGDVCAASGVVSACLALSAFDRRWAPADTAVIVSAADNGRRTGFLLRDERS